MTDRETILITGAGPHGVTGRRIKEFIATEFNILSPSSSELNLTDSKAVDKYFIDNKIDYVVHSAVVAPSRNHDTTDKAKEIESNLRMYFNLARHSNELKKMFCLGSGAEFDKSQPIKNFREEDYLTRIPDDKYGFIKYIINNHAVKSQNIYNIRIFGVINPYEPPTRNVVSLICAKGACGQDIILNQDCMFSFIDIDDVSRFIKFGIENELAYHDYNLVGHSCKISEMAEIARSLFPKSQIVFRKENEGNEYTGDNNRLVSTGIETTSLEASVKKVFDFLSSLKNLNTTEIERL